MRIKHEYERADSEIVCGVRDTSTLRWRTKYVKKRRCEKQRII